jgi:transcriptional regulator with XRE-family HTH domain
MRRSSRAIPHKEIKMKQENQSQLFNYTPEAFLERLCERLGARSLSALGRVVGLSPSVLSKVRRRRLAISSEILLKIHDATDIPVRELRRWMGDMRPYFSRVQLVRVRA